jgi:hypothetical protein
MYVPPPKAWAQICYEYENTDRPVEDICAEHGISSGTLRDRIRRWNLLRRRRPIPREWPPAVAVPLIELRRASAEVTPTPTLPLSGGGRSEDHEPSPHIMKDGRERPFVIDDAHERPCVADDARPIGERLNGAVARVMPALETTLASLAAGPLAPREMEQAARALGALTRTLRELNALLAQHRADTPEQSREELQQSLLRALEGVVARERDEQPLRYLAGWEEFAAEAEGTIASGQPRP